MIPRSTKAVYFAIVLLACHSANLFGEEIPLDHTLEDALVNGCLALVGKLPVVTFKIASETTFAQSYLEENPSRAFLNHQKALYSGVLSGPRYRVSSKLTRGDGTTFPDYTMTYDGDQSNFLDPVGRSNIVMKKGFEAESSGSFRVGTAAFLPYAFLFPTSDAYFVPNLSLERLANQETWRELFKTGHLVGVQKEAKTLQLKLDHPNGEYYIVTFSTNPDYYPIAFEKYAREGLMQRYSVGSFGVSLTPQGAQLRYPKEARLETFYAGHPRDTITLNTTEFLISSNSDNVEFSLDPSSVEMIYDADHHVRINVPK